MAMTTASSTHPAYNWSARGLRFRVYSALRPGCWLLPADCRLLRARGCACARARAAAAACSGNLYVHPNESDTSVNSVPCWLACCNQGLTVAAFSWMAESRLFLLRKLWIVHTLPAHAESKLGNNRRWKTNPATHKSVRSKSDHVRSTQLEIVCFESAMPGAMFSKHSPLENYWRS
eukprot:COSAG01_NODE_1675_length_9535_cov_6.782959_7_plen_176_part_00